MKCSYFWCILLHWLSVIFCIVHINDIILFSRGFCFSNNQQFFTSSCELRLLWIVRLMIIYIGELRLSALVNNLTPGTAVKVPLQLGFYNIVDFYWPSIKARVDRPWNDSTLTRSWARGPPCWTERGWLCFEGVVGSQQRRRSLPKRRWWESWHTSRTATSRHLRRERGRENGCGVTTSFSLFYRSIKKQTQRTFDQTAFAKIGISFPNAV